MPRQSVFDPCLPSLCGAIMKVRMTVYTQSHTHMHNYTIQDSKKASLRPIEVNRATEHTVDCNFSTEWCIKHLSVLRPQTCCLCRDRCTQISVHTQGQPHVSPDSAPATPSRVILFPTVLISQPRKQLCLLGTKHIGKWTRIVLNKTSTEDPLCPQCWAECELRSRKRIKKGIY